MDANAFDVRWRRGFECSLCEQQYHGIVRCALGWACWKTYLGRPEEDWARRNAMMALGNGLHDARHYEEAVSVREADFATDQRLGAPAENMLCTQSNLATTYARLGRLEEALQMDRDVYVGRAKLNGEEHERTLRAATAFSETDIYSRSR